MGYIVIVVYHPHEGKEADLLELIRNHLPILRTEGLATERVPLIMRSVTGALIEISEWNSEAAYENAHSNPVILALWAKFHKVCEYGTLDDLPECYRPFSPFEPIDL